jgi:SNF2 family DNA or RNA helicase
MGLGKSKSFLDTVAFLYDSELIDGVVCMAPKGCVNDWFDEHVPNHLPSHIAHKMVQWNASPNQKQLDELRSIMKPVPGVLHILVMNTEAVLGDLAYKAISFFLSHHKSMFGIDESTTIGNPQAKRTKEILSLGRLAAYRRIMTGDAAPNSPLTVFSQCDFLKPGLLGSNFYAFKAEYCETVKRKIRVPVKNGKPGDKRDQVIQQIVGYRNLDKLRARMSEFCFIVKKEDCLDLPPKIYQERIVEMGPKQKRMYEAVRDEAFYRLEQAERGITPKDVDDAVLTMALCRECDQIFQPALTCPVCGSDQIGPAPEVLSLDPSTTISAKMVIVQMMRLHQIACGFYTTDDGKTHGFDETNNRLEATLDALDEAPQKAILWAGYVHNIVELETAIAKKFGVNSIRSYYGATSNDDRRAAKRDFMDPESPVRWFLANQQTGKYGLTLTIAPTAIYYSNMYDREARAQSEDRNHRIGQRSAVNYLDIMCRNTVDFKIVKALKEKAELSALVSPSNWRRSLGV